MRCLLFTESAEAGGAEEVVRLLARGLREAGHSAFVLSLERGWLTDREFVEMILERNGQAGVVTHQPG